MATRRTIKNIVHNYTDAQVKVRDATSNDPWGPSSSTMSEIAHYTYNVMAFSDIMSMIWKRLNDHGKNWRHVYKALVLLEYIIKTGSERVAQQCRENIFAIQTLKDFEFFDKDGKDMGLNVREKSKGLVLLLKDEERLKQERVRALKAQERFAQASQGVGSSTVGKTELESSQDSNQSENAANTTSAAPSGTPPRSLSTDIEQARPQTTGEEELQLQLALAMSREEAEQKDKECRSDDIRLQMALDESTTGEPPLAQPATTLLNLASEPKWSSPPPQDAWGGAPPTNSSPAFNNTSNVTISDPWSNTSPAHKNPPPAAPAATWGVSAPPPSIDPWGATPAVPAAAVSRPVEDPWGGIGAPAPAAAAPDPWGSTAPVAPAVPSDPWNINGGGAAPDPDVEFDRLRVGPIDGAATISGMNDAFASPPMQIPAQSPTNNMFDMTGMDQALSGTPDRKKPEDFLGKNSKLVNLESLIGPTRETVGQPSMQGTNPFAMVPTVMAPSAMQPPPVNNPFQQQRMPAPTINQMRAQPTVEMTAGIGMGGMPIGGGMAFGGGTTLPPPLLPSSGGAPGQQQQTTNPFLL